MLDRSDPRRVWGRPLPSSITGSGWSTRYGVAAFMGVVAIALGVTGYLAGNRYVLLAGVVIVGGYALLAGAGGRLGMFRTLRGEFDEREQHLDYSAHRMAVNATGLVLVGLWVRDIINGSGGSPYPWLLAVMGVSYTLSWLFYQWRDG